MDSREILLVQTSMHRVLTKDSMVFIGRYWYRWLSVIFTFLSSRNTYSFLESLSFAGRKAIGFFQTLDQTLQNSKPGFCSPKRGLSMSSFVTSPFCILVLHTGEIKIENHGWPKEERPAGAE